MIRRGVAFLLKHWPWVALISCALMLGLAHYAQRVDGLTPCVLCLKQREAYWVAMVVAAAGVAAGFTPWRTKLRAPLNAGLMIAFLYSLGYATYHMGAEMKWWPGPKACAALSGASAQSIQDLFNSTEPVRVSCEDPVYWPIKGFITMATWNVLISLKLVGWSIAAVLWARKPA